MTLKIGALESWWDGELVVPGRTLDERLANLAGAGYQGVQLGPASMPIDIDALRSSLVRSGLTLMIHGRDGRLLAGDRGTRDRAVAEISAGLQEARELGAVGSLIVPIRVAPDMLAPEPRQFGIHRDASLVELEREVLIDQLGRIAVVAERLGIPLFIEPLNRFETHLLKTLEDAAAICRVVGSPWIKVVADFFHMNIEEADVAASIDRAGDVIGFVQLADSNRYQPGAGHIDFRPGFAALKRIGYDGWFGLECKIDRADAVGALVETAGLIRRTWSEAAVNPDSSNRNYQTHNGGSGLSGGSGRSPSS